MLCDAISYDGYTGNLLNLALVSGAKYHIKLVIIDGAGPAIDGQDILKNLSLTISVLQILNGVRPHIVMMVSQSHLLASS